MAAGWLPVLVNILILINRSSADCTDEVIGGRIFETHIWEVGVGLLKAFQNGILTESPMFSIWNGTVEERWYLRLYPNGYLPVHKGQVSIYLVSQNDFETRPEIELIVLNKEPLDIIRKFSITTYVRFDQSNGWSDFATLSTLLDPSQGFIFDDKIRFGARFSSDPPPIREPGDHETLAFFWTVRLNTMDLPNEISKESPKFYSWADNGGLITWNLRLYPQNSGQSNDTGSDIKTSFYAVYHGETPHVVDVELFVKNKKRENYVRSWSHIEYTKNGESSGLKDFINRDLLINPENGFVNDGEIVFGLRVPNFNVFPVEHKEVSVTRTWDVGLESFQKNNTGLDEISMESPKYIVYNGNKKEGWHLRLFPNGYQDENNGFVSLYLVFDGNHTSEPFAEVFIVNKDPRNNLRKWSSETYNEPNESMGWHKFISKEYLLDPTNGFVIGSKIKFGVRLRTDPTLPKPDRPMITQVWDIGMKLLQSGTTQLESRRYKIKIHNISETWHLRMYPKGYESQNAGFVSLYLVYSDMTTSYPRGEVFILNKKPENTIRKWSFGMYDSFGESIGWPRFIKFSDLIDEKNGFVFGGKTKAIKVGFKMPTDAEEGMVETCPICQDCPICEVPDSKVIPHCPEPVQPPPPPPQSALACDSSKTAISPPLESNNVDSEITRKSSNVSQKTFLRNITIIQGDVHFSAGEIISSTALVELISTLSKKTSKPIEDPGNYYHEVREWEVGLELLSALRNGGCTESPMFFITNGSVEQRWFIRLYPDGYLPMDKGSVSVYLVSQNDFETEPNIELSLLNKNPLKTVLSKSKPTYDHFESAGWDIFIQLSTLLDPTEGFMFDDKIKFMVEYTTDSTSISAPEGRETQAFLWALGLKTMNLPNGIGVESHQFQSWTPNGESTPLTCKIFPRGLSETDDTTSTMTSFFVRFLGRQPYTTVLELFVKNAKAENTLRLWMPVDFEQHGSYWGAVYFGRRELLVNPQNGFVDDDGTIVFGVRIPKFNEPLVEPEQYAISYTWDVGLELFNLKSTGFDEIALESPKFTVWNQQKNDVRFLRIYPDGYLDENNGFVSVQLVHDRNQTNAPLTKVFIVNKDPRNNLRRWSSDILYDNHVENMEWDRFITKEYLLDPSNGFVMDDKIKFGVQLRTDRVFPISGNPTFTNKWRIDIGSLLTSTSKIMSQNYEVKIHNTTETWYLEIYPNGKQFSDEGFVSLYLVSSNNSSIHPNAGIFLLNKKSENTIRKWYSELFNSPTTLGWDRLIKFSDLIDEKKGFVFGNETQFIEVGFTIAHETEDAKEVMPLKADPDPVIVPESLKIKLSTTVTTTVVTTPLPPVETTTLIPYQIEAVASNLL